MRGKHLILELTEEISLFIREEEKGKKASNPKLQEKTNYQELIKKYQAFRFY